MVTLTDSLQADRASGRLTLQTATIARDSTAIRCLDWDRDRFDIEFELQNGTTYNSFLIRGDQTALVDTSHIKFESLYFDCLKGLINPAAIDYLIVNHTEPDHSGLMQELLKRVPAPAYEITSIARQQIPEDPETTKEGLARRFGAVAGVLTLLDKFNTDIHAESEIRTLQSGQDALVTVLYLGLVPSGLAFNLWNLGATRVRAGILAVMNNLKIPLAVGVALLPPLMGLLACG